MGLIGVVLLTSYRGGLPSQIISILGPIATRDPIFGGPKPKPTVPEFKE